MVSVALHKVQGCGYPQSGGHGGVSDWGSMRLGPLQHHVAFPTLNFLGDPGPAGMTQLHGLTWRDGSWERLREAHGSSPVKAGTTVQGPAGREDSIHLL